MDVCESRVYSRGVDTLAEASAALSAVAAVVPAVEGPVVFGTPIGDPAWEQRYLRALLSDHRASLRALVAQEPADQRAFTRSVPGHTRHAAPAEHDARGDGGASPHARRATVDGIRACDWPPVRRRHPGTPGTHRRRRGVAREVKTVNAVGARGGPARGHDWARSQAQLRRADGDFSLGCASAPQRAAFLGSWTLAIQEGIHVAFPYVKVLAEACAEVARSSHLGPPKAARPGASGMPTTRGWSVCSLWYFNRGPRRTRAAPA